MGSIILGAANVSKRGTFVGGGRVAQQVRSFCFGGKKIKMQKSFFREAIAAHQDGVRRALPAHWDHVTHL